MNIQLSRFVAIGVLLLSLAFSWPAAAQSLHHTVPYEVLYNVAQPEQSTKRPAVQFESAEVVQEIPEPPDYSRVWLDGRVSFIGGELTTSERQFRYAEANEIPFIRNEAEGRNHYRSGRLVRLSHPLLNVGASNPYVLPETAGFIYDIVEQFHAAGCNRGSGQLRVNDALRPSQIRLSNSNSFTVHPTGMAVDFRVRNLLPEGMTQIPDEELPRNESTRCYLELASLLREAEAAGRADSTREYWRWNRRTQRRERNPHFHVVVIPEARPSRVTLEAHYEQPQTSGQSE